jgi:hypothetical protein
MKVRVTDIQVNGKPFQAVPFILEGEDATDLKSQIGKFYLAWRARPVRGAHLKFSWDVLPDDFEESWTVDMTETHPDLGRYIR